MKQDHSQIFKSMVKQIQDDPHRKSKQDLQQIAMINRKDRRSQKGLPSLRKHSVPTCGKQVHGKSALL